MDAVSYSHSAKQAKRIDNLFYTGETEPAKIVLGQEWYVPSTGKTYKRVADGTTEVWLDISATGSGLANHSEEFVVGTSSGNYDGVSTTVFPTVGTFNSSFANVYMNGSKLSASDYTTDGNSITLNTAASSGDVIAIETYNTFSIGDAYTKAEIDDGYATKTLSTTADLDVMNKVKNVDGAGSGLDADTVDGVQGALLGVGGAGYAWFDYTGSRSAGTTYTNTTGKPIGLNIVIGTSTVADSFVRLTVDGLDMLVTGTRNSDTSNLYLDRFSIIPANSTYLIDLSGGATIIKWFELK